MTARSLDQKWSLPRDATARIDVGMRSNAKSLALVDDTVALRRCALYRDAFKGTAVSYPAAMLGLGALAAWMRRHRLLHSIHEDDIIATLPKLLEAASVPAMIVSWAGDQIVSLHEWCTYLGSLVGQGQSSRYRGEVPPRARRQVTQGGPS